jgi:site-specific DNA recombinase
MLQRHQPKGKRAVFYARYSTDLQKDRSIDDQVALCREYAARNGMTPGRVYSDRAQTSSSLIGRDGIMQLMADARSGDFDVVIVEALDRISRDQEDLAGIFKRLSFGGIEIVAVHEGVADAMQIGIRGLLGSMFLADLKHKVRRGMAGVVADGRAAGGVSYGYDLVLGRPGERTINEEQAEVVRRIFRMYLGGMSPRDIAKQLNDEGILPPRGSKWNASTINGNKGRNYGILQNAMYEGKIIWNRVQMVRDPDTGKRVSRENPESEWKITEVPELRIVPADLFEAVQKRKALRSHDTAEGAFTRRPKRIFSGLLRCRYCGGGMASKGVHGGAVRVRCSRYTESGSCRNNRSYRLDRIEVGVIGGMLDLLQRPEATQAYLDLHFSERRQRIDGAARRAGEIERRLIKMTSEQDRLIKLYGDGTLPMDRVEARLKELQGERERLSAELAEAKVEVPVIEVHPTALRHFSRNLERVRQSIENEGTIHDRETFEAFRAAVSHIIVGDGPIDGDYEVDVVTYIAALTGEEAFIGKMGGTAGSGGGIRTPDTRIMIPLL